MMMTITLIFIITPIHIIIIYLAYYMFLQEKLKSMNLTKPTNILLYDIKLFYTGYFLLSMVSPAHVAFLGESLD